jgi:hypothetical protein
MPKNVSFCTKVIGFSRRTICKLPALEAYHA